MKSKISPICLISLIVLISLSAFAADTAILMSDGTIATDIKDIKPPLYFPANWKLFILIVILVVISGAGLAAYLFSRQGGGLQKFIIAPAAHEIAYKALDDLKDSNSLKAGLVKEYFFRLSFIVRQYLENRFSMRAPEMTTEEFLLSLKESDKLSHGIKDLLKDFMERADMVKFAKYGPTAQEIMGAFSAAKKLIDETKLNEQ